MCFVALLVDVTAVAIALELYEPDSAVDERNRVPGKNTPTGRNIRPVGGSWNLCNRSDSGRLRLDLASLVSVLSTSTGEGQVVLAGLVHGNNRGAFAELATEQPLCKRILNELRQRATQRTGTPWAGCTECPRATARFEKLVGSFMASCGLPSSSFSSDFPF